VRCPTGTTGDVPNCRVTPTRACPPPSIGVYPDCFSLDCTVSAICPLPVITCSITSVCGIDVSACQVIDAAPCAQAGLQCLQDGWLDDWCVSAAPWGPAALWA